MNYKLRLDQLLLEKGLASNPSHAQALIMAGKVLVNDQKKDKPGEAVKSDALIRLLKGNSQYVSRGAEKLAGAIAAFSPKIEGKTALDIGLSTGGFTDYLLQNKVKAVIGIDVGYGDVHNKLRQDFRLLLIERCNARHLTQTQLDQAIQKHKIPSLFSDPPSLVVMDVSFISVTKIIPALLPLVAPKTDFILLIKPQFESLKSEIGDKGLITDPAIHQTILERVKVKLIEQGLTFQNQCPSPITGTKGNTEFFFHLSN